MHKMKKKVEKTSLYRVYLRNLFSDTFFENPDCSVTQYPLPPSMTSLRHTLETIEICAPDVNILLLVLATFLIQ